MAIMAKKPLPSRPGAVQTALGTPEDSTVRAVLFRPDNERLIAAVDAYAKATRRSRNMAMNLLLEAALAAEGYWPPTRNATVNQPVRNRPGPRLEREGGV